MNLEAERIQASWKQSFGDCPPVSYLFKYRLSDRWFRIHSLPASKRYAENQSEMNELLERQNTVLLDVIGKDATCFLVGGNYSDSPLNEDIKQCSALGNFQFNQFTRLSKQDWDREDLEPDEEHIYLSLFYSEYILKKYSLNDVLVCVADGKIVNFFIADFDKHRIFAPYDGGVDVILENYEARNQFKSKYKDWLSNHPDGF